MSTQPMDWKNPFDLTTWRATRKKTLEKVWGDNFHPLLTGIALAAKRGDPLAGNLLSGPILRDLQDDGESLTARGRRLDAEEVQSSSKKPWSLLNLIGTNDAGETIFSKPAQRASIWKKGKAIPMVDAGLLKKANRDVGCGLLAGTVKCKTGHRFHVPYECGNRYCPKCGPEGARELFAHTLGPLKLAAAHLMECDAPNCKQCYWFQREQTKTDDGAEVSIPHWPPLKGERPARVVAILDFTMRNFLKGQKMGLSDLEDMRFWFKQFNRNIKRFFRALERQLGMTRSEYGVIWCDELGANNSNIHAHGVYCGPWLPQKNRELSKLWEKVTGGAGRIVYIKYVDSIDQALYHALKYPAKYASEEKTSPERAAHLEIIFHRVRRIHALASFYNMPKPKDDLKKDGLFNKCPLCGDQLSQPDFRFLLSDLHALGSRDVTELQREKGRAKVFAGGVAADRLKNTDNCAVDFLSSGAG
jgi:hypothetical protein